MKPTWTVRPASREEIDGFIQSHYLHRWPGIVVGKLALQDDQKLLGCVVFALPPRETCRRYSVQCAWELARLYLLDEAPKNSETWMLSRALNWVSRTRPEVQCVISYADPSAGHLGTIYKAGNWISDGRTDQERKSPRVDYAHPETGKLYSRRKHVPAGIIPVRVPRVSKFRYVYWLDGTHEVRRQKAAA